MLSEVAGGSACTCCPIQRAQCLRPPAGLRHGVRTRSSSSSGPRDSLSESRICLTALQGLRCGADSGTQVSTVSGKLGRLLLAGGPSGALAAARPTRTHADAAAPSCAQETQPGAARRARGGGRRRCTQGSQFFGCCQRRGCGSGDAPNHPTGAPATSQATWQKYA